MQLIHLAQPDDVNRVLAKTVAAYVGEQDIEMLFDYHDSVSPRTMTELAERFDLDRTNVGRRIRAAMVKLRCVGLLPKAWETQMVAQD